MAGRAQRSERVERDARRESAQALPLHGIVTDLECAMDAVLLLSPAYCGGRRAASLLRQGSTLAIADRLEAGSLTLGEAFTFCSGLYFRGKITYARRFAPDATFVITPTRGLQSPDTIV